MCCVQKEPSLIIIGVPHIPKDVFLFYLADIDVLFEKQNHYPLTLIGNSNLSFP